MNYYGIDYIVPDDFDPYKDDYISRWDDDDRAYDKWVDECFARGIDPNSPFAEIFWDDSEDYDREEIPCGLMFYDDDELEDIEF